MPKQQNSYSASVAPISVIMFDNTTTSSTENNNRHHIEAIVFTPTTTFEYNTISNNDRNQHKRQRSKDSDVPLIQYRRRLVSYENEEELRAKMNALYEDASSMDDQDDDEPSQILENGEMESNDGSEVVVPQHIIRKVRFEESFRQNNNRRRRAIEPIPFPATATSTSRNDNQKVPTANEKQQQQQQQQPLYKHQHQQHLQIISKLQRRVTIIIDHHHTSFIVRRTTPSCTVLRRKLQSTIIRVVAMMQVQ